MMNVIGKVKFWDGVRGFGSVETEDKGPDVFVHFSDLRTRREYKELVVGELVSLEVEETVKGRRGVNVTPVEELREQ